MSSNNWLAVLFLSFTIVPFSFSSQEFTFPLCSEAHIKAEYAIEEPVPCKQHLHEQTKKCNVCVFDLEHNMFSIPAHFLSTNHNNHNSKLLLFRSSNAFFSHRLFSNTFAFRVFIMEQNRNSNQCRQTH